MFAPEKLALSSSSFGTLHNSEGGRATLSESESTKGDQPGGEAEGGDTGEKKTGARKPAKRTRKAPAKRTTRSRSKKTEKEPEAGETKEKPARKVISRRRPKKAKRATKGKDPETSAVEEKAPEPADDAAVATAQPEQTGTPQAETQTKPAEAASDPVGAVEGPAAEKPPEADSQATQKEPGAQHQDAGSTDGGEESHRGRRRRGRRRGGNGRSEGESRPETADKGQVDQSRAEQGRSDQGRTQQGRSGQGRGDKGRSDQGRGDKGRGDRGRERTKERPAPDVLKSVPEMLAESWSVDKARKFLSEGLLARMAEPLLPAEGESEELDARELPERLRVIRKLIADECMVEDDATDVMLLDLVVNALADRIDIYRLKSEGDDLKRMERLMDLRTKADGRLVQAISALKNA